MYTYVLTKIINPIYIIIYKHYILAILYLVSCINIYLLGI